jgi:hypothetical protein
MASQVGGDLSKITTGVCKVTYKTVACGHTSGGVTVMIKHKTRERKVDEYGESVVDLIHVGDDVTVKTKFVEKTLQVIQTVYQFGGEISSSMWGIGKVPGTKGSSLAGALLLHPLDGDGVKDDITVHKAVVKDQGDVQFGDVNQDRTFDVTFQGLVDESQSTYLIAKFGTSIPSV